MSGAKRALLRTVIAGGFCVLAWGASAQSHRDAETGGAIEQQFKESLNSGGGSDVAAKKNKGAEQEAKEAAQSAPKNPPNEEQKPLSADEQRILKAKDFARMIRRLKEQTRSEALALGYQSLTIWGTSTEEKNWGPGNPVWDQLVSEIRKGAEKIAKEAWEGMNEAEIAELLARLYMSEMVPEDIKALADWLESPSGKMYLSFNKEAGDYWDEQVRRLGESRLTKEGQKAWEASLNPKAKTPEGSEELANARIEFAASTEEGFMALHLAMAKNGPLGVQLSGFGMITLLSASDPLREAIEKKYADKLKEFSEFPSTPMGGKNMDGLINMVAAGRMLFMGPNITAQLMFKDLQEEWKALFEKLRKSQQA